MRVLHLTPYYAPAYAFGGVARSVEGMAKALAQRGHEVTVLTTDALDQRRRVGGGLVEDVAGVRVLRCRNLSPRLRGRLNLSTPRGLRVLAGAALAEVDVLHAHEFRTLENLLVLPVARRMGVPIVLSPHGTLSRGTGRGGFKSAWDRLLSPGIAGRVDCVIALTGTELAEARTLWAGFGAGRTEFATVPNGVDSRDFASLPAARVFRERYGLGEGAAVLYLGRLQARKGVDRLIEAFRLADVADSRLIIAGPDEGMLSRLRELAGDDKRVVFTGYLAGDERLWALAAADVFALPARGEGQPMAALEALAAGLPVLLSPGCNLDEAAQYGAGFVVEPEAGEFAERLCLLLSDGGLRRRMGARGRRLVAERYDWSRVGLELEGVYARLLEGAGC